MLRKLMNWLMGYLEVQISGRAPERFINMCAMKKILLWNMSYQTGGCRFYISVKNYRKLKPIARKSHLIPKITRKYGLPFLLYRYRKRKFFFAGVILCLTAVYIMSLYIWEINFLGGYKYTQDTMLQFLKENGIYSGIKISRVDCQEIEEQIRLAYSDIGWVSAEIKGTKLIIKITETNMPAPAQEARAPSHIVATKDAIIKEIVTRTGSPKVRPGAVVKKGDILVSGIVPVQDDFGGVLLNKPVIASASINCKTYYDYSYGFSLNYIKRTYTGKEKKGYYISMINKRIFLYKPSNPFGNYDIIEDVNTLHLTKTYILPFQYGSMIIREYEEKPAVYTEEQAMAIAQENLQRYMKRLSDNGVLIIENNVTIKIENEVCIAAGRILVEEPAWEYRVINESEWRIEQTDEHNGDNH